MAGFVQELLVIDKLTGLDITISYEQQCEKYASVFPHRSPFLQDILFRPTTQSQRALAALEFVRECDECDRDKQSMSRDRQTIDRRNILLDLAILRSFPKDWGNRRADKKKGKSWH